MVNSGDFMSGNVGSERRLEYTALGDTTNTAARRDSFMSFCSDSGSREDVTRMLKEAAIDLNAIGYIVVALFAVTWLVALAVWRFGRIEQRWAAPAA